MYGTLLFFAVLAICWTFFKKLRHMANCAKEIPEAKGLSLLGCLKAKTANDSIKLVLQMGRKYREHGITKKWLGCFLFVQITDPKYTEVIAESPYATEQRPLVGVLLHGFPNGLFATNDMPKWRELRKGLKKSLKKKHLENEQHSIFLSRNKRFVKHLEEKRCGKEINVKTELQNITSDIVSEIFLGVDTNEVEEMRFQFLECAMTYIGFSMSVGKLLQTFKIFGFLKPLTMNDKMKTNLNRCKEFLSWAFQERMKKQDIKGNLNYYTDFLLKRKIEQNLTMDDIERELIDVLIASTDSSAIVLSSTILFLAMFPEIQEEAYQEQVSIFGENSTQEPTPEDIDSMVYLTRVLKEALRFCSPPMVLKYATEDIQVDKYTIPKGTIILVNIDALCFDEQYWENPRTFNPDHFLPEKEAERPAYASPVFGFGHRGCPGAQYAMYSMRVTMSYILRHFKMSTSAKFEDIKVEYNLMREFDSFIVKFEKITSCNADTFN